MGNDRELLCRVCLKRCGCGFEVIDATIREIFQVLLLDLDLTISNKPVVCYTCLDSLIKCFDTKADHVQKNDNIIGTVKNVSNVSGSGSKCCLCLELTNFEAPTISLNNVDGLANVLEKHFELASNDTQELVLCMTCYESLHHHFIFISNCLVVEKDVRDFRDVRGTNSKGQMKLKDVIPFIVEHRSKNSYGSNSAIVMKNAQSAISNECCVKTEECQLNTDSEDIKMESEQSHHSRSKDDIQQDTETDDDSLVRTVYKCHTCSFQSYLKYNLNRHLLNHNGATVNCEICSFTTKQKTKLQKHIVELTMYKCEICAFETNRKPQLGRRLLTHKSSSEVKMHKCKICAFQTKHKVSMGKHMLLHKSTSEVEIFKCDKCPFESKYKTNLQGHMLIHKSTSEVTMYKCTTCAFETKRKRSLQDHMITHRSSAEVTMHKCKICAFQTKYKSYIGKHMLLHKSASEVEIFKCDKCPFESKYSLQGHMLIHKSTSEVTMYKCATCAFETKRKRNLQDHMITHRSSAEVTMHKCKICAFQTKYKGYIRKHMLLHKSTSEVEVTQV